MDNRLIVKAQVKSLGMPSGTISKKYHLKQSALASILTNKRSHTDMQHIAAAYRQKLGHYTHVDCYYRTRGEIQRAITERGLGVRKAAELIGKPEHTVRNWMNKGKPDDAIQISEDQYWALLSWRPLSWIPFGLESITNK